MSLLPKTKLIDLYQNKYGFRQFGRLLAVEGKSSQFLIQKYLFDEEEWRTIQETESSHLILINRDVTESIGNEKVNVLTPVNSAIKVSLGIGDQIINVKDYNSSSISAAIKKINIKNGNSIIVFFSNSFFVNKPRSIFLNYPND